MSVLAPEPVRSTAAAEASETSTSGDRVLLEGVAWPQYVTITEALMGNPGVRTTYDRGSFELRSTSNLHECIKKRLGRFLEVIAEELDVAIQPGGNTTFRNEELERGFEPDECYWIATEARMRVPVTSWEPLRQFRDWVRRNRT